MTQEDIVKVVKDYTNKVYNEYNVVGVQFMVPINEVHCYECCIELLNQMGIKIEEDSNIENSDNNEDTKEVA